MKKITSLLTILVVGILVSSGFGAVALNSNREKFDTEVIGYNKSNFTHTVLGEFGTATTCVPCKYAHQALKEIYACEWYLFYYVTLVRDKNNHALKRTEELNQIAVPTVFFDGGYEKVEGAVDKEWAMGKYNQSIELCGNRDVADIDLSVDVEWLGAVNPVPTDGETNVSICCLSWNLSAMNIDISVDNNELSEYSGHLHVYVTELGSSYWVDKFNNPYTFAFLDYAWNEDIEISAGSSWQDSMEWDGTDYDNGYSGEEKVIFYDIWQDNTMIIASVFDGDTNYTDETAGIIAGIDTCPKIFNLYFGNYTPPPLVACNFSIMSFVPAFLEWNTTYYWKVDVIDNQGNIINGTIWNFTTRGNNPPDLPSNPEPYNGETDVDVNTNISWSCNDPEGDDVFYDVYFGKTNPPPKVVSNQSEESFDPTGILDFNSTYYWQIVAWDIFGLPSFGPLWSFTTEENLPPNIPSNPHPPDGVTNAPVYVTLRWSGGDPNPGDIVTYNVYLGNAYPPQKLVSINQTETCFEPKGLELNRTYFWSIVAWDSRELSTAGPCWLFKTAINSPPSAPNIEGPKIKSKSKSIDQKKIAQPPGTYNYTFKAIDPDDDNIYYHIDWGDGYHEDWFGPFASGEEVVVSHTWSGKGKYSVKAKAKDIYDQEGPLGYERILIRFSNNWLFNLIFNMLNRLFERYPNMFPIFRYIIGL